MKRWMDRTPEEMDAEYKAQQQKRLRKHRRKIRQWYEDFMATQSCADCGDDRRAVLEWHHLEKLNDSKARRVSFWGHGGSWKKLHAELAKCVCLCASCHRMRHAEERELRELL